MVSLLLFLLLHVTEKPAIPAGTGGPQFTPDSNRVDYGSIAYGASGYREVYFTNTDNAPLLIHNVNSSCGCLVPYAPREPIAPGKKDKIGMRYDTTRIGPFQKTLTVVTNEAEGHNIHIIRLCGKVLPKEPETPVMYNKP